MLFEGLGIDRVVEVTDDLHAVSVRLLERLGFAGIGRQVTDFRGASCVECSLERRRAAPAGEGFGCVDFVAGADVVLQSFLREGLVDELTLTTIPVLLGRGRRLFGPLPADVRLELLGQRCWDHGVVQQRWRVDVAVG